ncbi:cobalamin biosynthesis protein [Actinoplanes sp. NPDC049596]|uniref:cobalamin biosynthesis protein n=1 Tax=unclassified Actinoplanes TaxID=2626549 RepID=UPI00342046B1
MSSAPSADLVVGLGARRGADAADLRAAVDQVLAAAGVTPAAVGVLATVDRRAGDPGVRLLALDLGWRLTAVPAEVLAAQPVPHPSPAVAAMAGTPSVAEAAALHVAGPGGILLVPKTICRSVTVAVVRVRSG